MIGSGCPRRERETKRPTRDKREQKGKNEKGEVGTEELKEQILWKKREAAGRKWLRSEDHKRKQRLRAQTERARG